MSWRVFASGVLLETWDDAALVHGQLVGGAWVTRPYTAEEAAEVTPTPAPPDPLDSLTVAVLVSL